MNTVPVFTVGLYTYQDNLYFGVYMDFKHIQQNKTIWGYFRLNGHFRSPPHRTFSLADLEKN